MAILAGEGVDDEHQLGVEYDQGVPRQSGGPHGPQLFDAMLGPGQMVAVEDLDAIAWQQRRGAAVHGGDDRRQTLGRQAHQRGPYGRLDALDLSVKRWERDINGDGVLLVGGIDRGSDPANDQAHQPNNRREKEIARVLPVGGLLEELINDSWAERAPSRLEP